MMAKTDGPFSGLEKIFHEPNRLAIMSSLCAAGAEGMTFNGLRGELDLTDGNLSRHLKALEEAGMARMDKQFVDAKPRTTVFTTDAGWDAFVDYLNNLEQALKTAAAATAGHRKKGRKFMYPKLAHRPAKA